MKNLGGRGQAPGAGKGRGDRPSPKASREERGLQTAGFQPGETQVGLLSRVL